MAFRFLPVWLSAFFFTFILSGLAEPAPLPTINNPSFEADTFTVFPGYVSGNGPITGWASLDNHGINPAAGSPFANNGVIPDGIQVAFLQGDGALSQVIDGFVVGETYQIEYYENARTGGTRPALEVSVGGVVLVPAHLITPVGAGNPYVRIATPPFVAGDTSLELVFTKSNPQGGDTTALVDNVGFLPEGTAPFISLQPRAVEAGVGSTVTFGLTAGGSGELSYQWFRDGDPIGGETSSTLSFTATDISQVGDYSVEVSNGVGSLMSESASLAIFDVVPGLFNTGVDESGVGLADGSVDPHYQLIVNAENPSSVDAIVQDSTAFPIVAGPWLANNAGSKWIGPLVNTSGAAGQATNNGRYVYQTTFDLTGVDIPSVVITGGWTSDNEGLSLSVNGTPTGLSQGGGFGALVAFSISSANATFVEGVNTLEFEVNNADANVGYTGLRVDNLRGRAILPGTPPSITLQPRGQLAGVGDTVTLAAAATGSSPLTYQWSKDGEELAGETGSSLVLENVTAANNGTYTVAVTNPNDVIVSDEAVLEVLDVFSDIANTGVDDAGILLADGAVDSHYRLVVNPDSGTGSTDALVEDSTLFPIVAGPWVANSAQSKWIGPRLETSAAAGAEGEGGDYVYSLTFNLTGFDPATVVLVGGWASDNAGVDISLNGVSSGNTNDGNFATLHPFSIAAGGVQAGLNELTFRVNNSAAGYTGLRVEGIRGLGDLLPAGTMPFIVKHPQSINRFITEIAMFSVSANGSAPLSYQWYFGPDPIPGETGPTLSFLVDFPDVAGDYSVEVSNASGSIRSDVATLSVSDAPSITQQPQSQTVGIGASVNFSVTAVGEPPLGYQWFKDGDPIPGAEASTLALDNVTPEDAGAYSVQVFNFGGEETSADAILTVLYRVAGLYNTGVDDSGTVLPSGTVDPHYVLTQSSDPAYPGPHAIVITDTGFPFPPWLPSDGVSKWIAPQVNQGVGNLPGDYTYETSFDLGGYDVSDIVALSGEWTTDNAGLDILLNGVSTGLQNNAQFTVWTPFVITTGFVPGLNTLAFQVNNGAPTGPTGLRVQNLQVLTSAPGLVLGPVEVGDGSVTLTWAAVEGTIYRVQYKNDLNDTEWTDLPGDVTATGSTATKTDETVGDVGQRFYQVLRVELAMSDG